MTKNDDFYRKQKFKNCNIILSFFTYTYKSPYLKDITEVFKLIFKEY